MAEKNELGSHRGELSNRISGWAVRANLTDNLILASIIEAIKTNRLGQLSFLNSIDTFWPKVKSNCGKQLIRVSQIIAVARNALIFVPVALTWKSVSEATYGFANFTTENKGVPVNFLTFWQTGYGYIDEFWQIGHVAELDFQLILLVILLTLISVFINRYGNSQRIKELEALHEEGQLILFDLTLLVAGKAAPTGTNLDKLTRDALITLSNSMSEADDLLVELSSFQKEVSNSIELILKYSEKLEESAERQNLILEKLVKLTADLDEISDMKAKQLKVKRSVSNLIDDLESL